MAPRRSGSGSVAARLAATRSVLVIEDERDIAEFLGAWFKASGYAIVHVDPGSPDEAVAAVAEHRPSCILLDLGLRGFSGLTVYRRLRADPAFAAVPVIIITADATARRHTSELAEGLDDFVAKPFDVRALGDLVAERIEAGEALAERLAEEDSSVGAADWAQGRLVDEVELARRTGGTVAFALVALGGARAAIESFGEEAVRFVSRRVAERLREGLGAGATIGRADDEVLVVLPDTDAAAAEKLLVDAVAAAGDEVVLPGGGVIDPRLGAGLAVYPDHGQNADEVYMAADAVAVDALRDRRPVVAAL